MVLAIISFGLEVIFASIVNGLGNNLSEGFAWFIIIMYVICTIVSGITLFTNIKGIKSGESRGKYITGTVFSGVGLGMGLIFCISCFSTMASLM